MVHKDKINSNIDLINKYIQSTVNINIYKEGILGINKENNLIYLNLNNQIIESNIEIKYNSFMFRCLKCNHEDEKCLVLTSKKILYVDIHAGEILLEFFSDINLINFIFYKKDTLIGFLKNRLCIFNINDQLIIKLMNVNTKYYSMKYLKDEKFYYVSGKKLYMYDILNKDLAEKKTHYIGVDKYDILDISSDLHIVSVQIHTCVCVWGINSDRSKCFIGHFDPKFKNIKKVMEDIKDKLGEEYNNMKINILGGNSNNISYNYLQNVILKDHEYNLLDHVLKPYNIIISKKETLIC